MAKRKPRSGSLLETSVPNEWEPTAELRWVTRAEGRVLQQRWKELKFYYGYAAAGAYDRMEETGRYEWRDVPETKEENEPSG